jgi:hypothetical protein
MIPPHARPSFATRPTTSNRPPILNQPQRRARARTIMVAYLAGLAWLALPTLASAQLSGLCLRPLAIPDKWQEAQALPWDLGATFDRYDAQGQLLANPDVYRSPLDAAPTGTRRRSIKGVPSSCGWPGRERCARLTPCP